MKFAKIIFLMLILIICGRKVFADSGQIFANSKSTSSAPIIISEVFPNPKGQDKGREWIEITNKTNEKYSLKGWYIKNSRKKFILPRIIIHAQKTIVFQKLPFALKNTNEDLLLFNSQNELQNEIKFTKSIEDFSYSELGKNNFFWTNPSKNQSNPQIKNLNGIIVKNPEIGKKYFFQISDSRYRKNIFFSEPLKYTEIAKKLTKGKKTVIMASKNLLNDYEMLKYEIIETNMDNNPIKEKSKSRIWLWLILGTGGIILTWRRYLFKILNIKYHLSHLTPLNWKIR